MRNLKQKFRRLANAKIMLVCGKTRTLLCNREGSFFTEHGFSILIVVVIAALLLGAVFAMFGDQIIPALQKKITELFNYKG